MSMYENLMIILSILIWVNGITLVAMEVLR